MKPGKVIVTRTINGQKKEIVTENNIPLYIEEAKKLAYKPLTKSAILRNSFVSI